MKALTASRIMELSKLLMSKVHTDEQGTHRCFRVVAASAGEPNQRMESLERYRDKKRRRLFSGAKTIRYEKRKVNADCR